MYLESRYAGAPAAMATDKDDLKFPATCTGLWPAESCSRCGTSDSTPVGPGRPVLVVGRVAAVDRRHWQQVDRRCLVVRKTPSPISSLHCPALCPACSAACILFWWFCFAGTSEKEGRRVALPTRPGVPRDTGSALCSTLWSLFYSSGGGSLHKLLYRRVNYTDNWHNCGIYIKTKNRNVYFKIGLFFEVLYYIAKSYRCQFRT